METQTRLSRHNKFISAENVVGIFSVCLVIAHIFRFVCINMEAYACCCSFQTMQKCFGLVRCICQYRYVIGVVGVGNETQFLPSSGHIDTAIWMHYMDANKTAGEETRWQLHKNAACNPEQVLAATPHKTPTVRPPAPYHENYSS